MVAVRMNGTERGLTSSVNNRGKDNGGMLKKIAEEKDISYNKPLLRTAQQGFKNPVCW